MSRQGVAVQALSLTVPMVYWADGAPGSRLAASFNDAASAAHVAHPDRFVGCAMLPMQDTARALAELERAAKLPGIKGVYMGTNVGGRELSDPAFFPVFERVTRKHDLPIWMHPARPATRADYVNEQKSKYEIWQVLGWPFETSVAMARIVFSGLFEKLPDLRLITHHCGAMIPFFAGRAETLWAQLGSRSVDENYDEILKRMTKKPIDYFKMFYADTVLGGSASALRCGLDFFGADKIVFASDCPFDPEGGPMFIREGMRSIEDLNLSENDKRKIYFGNALRLMRMPEKPQP